MTDNLIKDGNKLINNIQKSGINHPGQEASLKV